MVIRYKHFLGTLGILTGICYFFISSLDHVIITPETKRILYREYINTPLEPPNDSEDPPECELKDLYTDIHDANIVKDFESLQYICKEYRRKFLHIFQHQGWQFSELQQAILEYSSIIGKANTLKGYLKIMHYKNIYNKETTHLYEHIHNQIIMCLESINFIRSNLIFIPQERLNYGYQFYPSLSPYKNWIEEIRRNKEHCLSPAVEQTLRIKAMTSKTGWLHLYEDTIHYLKRKNAKRSTQNPNTGKSTPSSPPLHTLSFEQISLFARILNNLFLDQQIDAICHNFTDPLEAECFRLNMKRSEIDHIFEQFISHLSHISNRYYMLKAKILGKTKISADEANQPVFHNLTPEIPWNIAKKCILNSIKPLGYSIQEGYKSFFSLNRIEAIDSENKKSIAFSQPFSGNHYPCVFFKYKKTLDSVFTLSRILGDAVNQSFSYPDCTDLLAKPMPIFRGVFGAFSELVFFDYMFKKVTNPTEEASLLCTMIERKLETFIKQAMICNFERNIYHQYVKTSLNPINISSEWLNTMKKYFGSEVIIDHSIQYEWIMNSQLFHTPFNHVASLFAENIANLLFLNFKQIKADDTGEPFENFIKQYLNFMNSGVNFSSAELQNIFNIDIHQKNFWNNGLALMEEWLNHLEKLLAQYPELCSP